MALLETFQECTRRGENTTVFLETRNGAQFVNLRVKLPASSSDKSFLGSTTKKKSPSTRKRDRERLINYVKKKSLQESWKENQTSTHILKTTPEEVQVLDQPFPASCSFVMETSNEVSCEDGDGDLRAGDKDAETNSEKTQTKQGLSRQDFDQILKKFDKLLETRAEKNNDDDAINEEDSNDNIEAAKKWTIQQKLSLANRKS